MSEEQQTDGTQQVSSGNPAPQPAPQTTEPTIPEGKRLVDATEYEQLSRQANNFKGSAPMIDRLVKSGVKTVDDLERVLGSNKKLNDLGIDLDQLSSAFRQEYEEATPEQKPAFDPEDIDSLIDKRVNSRLAEDRYQSAAQQESKLFEAAAKELAGSGASRAKIDAAKRLIEHEARNGSAQFYDEFDPVMGSIAGKYFKPHDEKSIASVKEKVGALWKELSASEIRDAAKRGTPSPGQSATGGDGPTTDGKQNRRFVDLSHDEKIAFVQKMQNQRMGATPMSQG